MITSVVGRLIKKPELVERIHIPGKRVVAFTIVQNSQRGEKRLSVFFNLSMVIATDAQFEMVMRLEKGTVLLFSAPRITYVKQVDRDEHEQVINIYAEIDNFRIVAGAQGATGEAASSPHPADAAAFEETEDTPPLPPQQQRRAVAPAASSRPEASGRAPATQRPMPSARPNPPRTAAVPPDDLDGDDYEEAGALLSNDALSDLSDPFDEVPPPSAPARRPAAGASPPRAAAAPAPAQTGVKRTPPAATPQNRQSPPRPPHGPAPPEPSEEDDPFA